MRHRNLVFAALIGLFSAFTVLSQAVESDFGPDMSRAIKGGRKADQQTPQVMGKVTDFAGRSVKAAEIRFIGVEFDEVVSVKSNAFGFYQVADLTAGRSYFVSVNHKRYLFVIAPTEVLVGEKTVEFNFQGDLAR